MQHYDKRGQHDVALTKIDEAIAHTPTVIDLYSVKVCLLCAWMLFYSWDAYLHIFIVHDIWGLSYVLFRFTHLAVRILSD